MIINRALRSSGCASCRFFLLRSFTSIAGPPLRIPYASSRLPARSIPRQNRLYSSQENRPRDDLEHGEQELVDEELEDLEALEAQDGLGEAAEALEAQGDLGEAAEAPAVPWYLQVQSPQREVKPLSERQRIPELPENPPPILQPLFQQISIDLGLDNLTLLDLRKLDPPPALGANLVMLIGTARSERHLHVSADRLCRWLRSTYKLRPDADGLLGRNELKLKLRRKAKRAKLMGNKSADDEDDGMRTGWVCVDVGVVESPESEIDTVVKKDFVGFGRKTDGVRLVVQMLTEEKREEMELERLWSGILKRSGQQLGDVEESEIQLTNDGPGPLDSTLEESHIQPAADDPIPEPEPVLSSQRSGNGSTVTGVRGYHTFARRPRFDAATQRRSHSTTNANRPFSHDGGPSEIQGYLAQAISVSHFDKAMKFLEAYKAKHPQLPDEAWRPFMLDQILSRLQSVSKKDAFDYLGKGYDDYSSTPFLQCFYQALSDCPTGPEVDARIWLHCFAQVLGHEGYRRSGLLELFDELKICGAEISQTSFMRLIRGVLQAMPSESWYYGLPKEAIEGAMDILQTMHNRGFTILDENVLVELQALVSPGPNKYPAKHLEYQDQTETFDLPSYPMNALQERLHRLIMALDLPLFRDESRIRLMDMYSDQRHWLEFWEIWRMAPRRSKPQSAKMYAFMFQKVGEAVYKKGAMTVVQNLLPQMQKEDPPIQLEGNVAEAVRTCLIAADPQLPARAENNPEPSEPGDLMSWWIKAGGLASWDNKFLYD